MRCSVSLAAAIASAAVFAAGPQGGGAEWIRPAQGPSPDRNAAVFARALGEYGYAETALRIFAQPEYPGWEWQRRKGATTIWEDFKGVNSHNHVIFGDPSAWAFRYLGGIRFRDGKAEKVEPLRPISGGFFKATCRGLAVSRGG